MGTALQDSLHRQYGANWMVRSDEIEGGSVYDVIIRTTNVDALRRQGVHILAESGGVITARTPLSSLLSMMTSPFVIHVDMEKKCYPSLDVSAADINVPDVWDGDLGTPYTGAGVIVGVYDSGIDWSHPDFIDENGSSRILYLWDQTDDSGSAPSEFEYGSEYRQPDINDEIDGTPAGVVQGKDTWGHGTHVAGIAAGNGRGTGNSQPSGTYKGVAPEADLIIVKGGNQDFNTFDIQNGLSYIFQKAASFDPPRPCVINLSVGGTHEGPHDGTSDFETFIDGLLLGQPGRAVVVPAGNDGTEDIHFYSVFTSVNDADSIAFEIGDNTEDVEDVVRFDVWFPIATDVSAVLVTPSGERYGSVPGSAQTNYTMAEGDISFTFHTHEGKPYRELLISLSDHRDGAVVDNLASGSWKLVVAGNPGWVDGWLFESSMESQITEGADTSTLIREPGNAFNVITVGSYVSREEWPSLYQVPWGPEDLTIGALSNFSSPGPTRYNADLQRTRKKPDIAAPGEYILSSLSGFLTTLRTDAYVATDSVHTAMAGTSMAAPHVTGVIALMFEADPSLTPSEVLGKLIMTTRTDAYTGAVWNAHWGYGKLDALEAMRMTTPVIEEVDVQQPDGFRLHQNFPNPFNGETVIVCDIPSGLHCDSHRLRLSIYDPAGRRIRCFVKEIAPSGNAVFRWDGQDDAGNRVPSGVYVYRLTAGNRVFSRKMVLLE